MKAQSHLWLCQFGSYLRYGMLSSCICSTLVSVCAMKGIPIGPLVPWGKDLTYYLTPFFCLINWDTVCTTLVVHVEGQTWLRADYIHVYISIYINYYTLIFEILHVSILKDHLQIYLKLAVCRCWPPQSLIYTNDDYGVNIDVQAVSYVSEDDILDGNL